MNTYSVNKLSSKLNRKHIELAVYVLLTVGLIGNLFEINGLVTMLNVTLVAIGIFFGMLVSVGWTPLSGNHEPENSDKAAKILAFQGDNSQSDSNKASSAHDESKHAA